MPNTKGIILLTGCISPYSWHQYEGARGVQQFEGLLDRLGRVVNHLKQPVNNKLIAFENMPYYKGREYFDAQVDAVTLKRPLTIRYKKFNRRGANARVSSFLFKRISWPLVCSKQESWLFPSS